MSENLKLQVSRVIHAKRSRVYDAWTKPELIQQWFGPENMTVASASTELRVGGAYRIEMQSSRAATGVYKKIVPNELLCFTWRGDWNPSEETLVTVAFKDVEGGTEVTLAHERFATAESMGKHEHGWNGSLAKLATLCEK
ncbi:MAG: SRPBCC family protein [Acidobacteriaceae bacterium]